MALWTIDTAMSRSASLSTYAWHTPMPPVIAGIAASAATRRTSSAPPRGTTRSMYSFMASISPTRLLSVESTNWTASTGAPDASIPSLTTDARTELEASASLPPFSITALPDLKQSAAMSTVTLGRLS